MCVTICFCLTFYLISKSSFLFFNPMSTKYAFGCWNVNVVAIPVLKLSSLLFWYPFFYGTPCINSIHFCGNFGNLYTCAGASVFVCPPVPGWVSLGVFKDEHWVTDSCWVVFPMCARLYVWIWDSCSKAVVDVLKGEHWVTNSCCVVFGVCARLYVLDLGRLL